VRVPGNEERDGQSHRRSEVVADDTRGCSDGEKGEQGEVPKSVEASIVDEGELEPNGEGTKSNVKERRFFAELAKSIQRSSEGNL